MRTSSVEPESRMPFVTDSMLPMRALRSSTSMAGARIPLTQCSLATSLPRRSSLSKQMWTTGSAVARDIRRMFLVVVLALGFSFLFPASRGAICGLVPTRPRACAGSLPTRCRSFKQGQDECSPCGGEGGVAGNAENPFEAHGLTLLLSPTARVCVAAALLAWSLAAHAMDRAIAPPTCPSEPFKCRAREPKGSIQIAEQRFQDAKTRLREAEDKLGAFLAPGDLDSTSPYFGRAETLEFWRAERQRLVMNRVFLDGLRSALQAEESGGKTAPAASPSSPPSSPPPASSSSSSSTAGRAVSPSQLEPLRLLSRLVIESTDVELESRFWCEAVGMQRYGTLADGSALVAYGPPGFNAGDEGAFFAVEIRPLAAAKPSREAAGQAARPRRERLSFVQIAVPNQLRVYKINETGGILLDGYGFYELRSPAGVIIRAYIDDRRDPVEFVALASDDAQATARELELMGLTPRGSYRRVSVTQSEMPRLPAGGVLYGGIDPKQTPQILVLPFTERPSPPPVDNAAAPAESQPDEDRLEAPYTPLSYANNPKVVILGPRSSCAASAAAAAGARPVASSAADSRVGLGDRRVPDPGNGSRSPLVDVELQPFESID